jgi:putative transposase
VREIIGQVADECGVKFKNGVLSADHVHIFAEIPPHLSVIEFVKHVKGRSSRKIQQEKGIGKSIAVVFAHERA